MSFSFLQRPLQVKKFIWENSTKYVNQTGNFYFWQKLKTAISLPIFNIFENFLLDESSCLDLYINLKIKISKKWSVWRCSVTLIIYLMSKPSFSSPKPTILLACSRNRELWEQPFWNNKGNDRILPIRSHAVCIYMVAPRALDSCRRPEGS